MDKIRRARHGPVSKGALIEPPMPAPDAKIFAEPLQSATALRQSVRLGEELQREPSATASLAPPTRHGPTGFVQNEDSFAAAVRRCAENRLRTSETDRSFVCLHPPKRPSGDPTKFPF